MRERYQTDATYYASGAPSSAVQQTPPDFDSYVQEKMKKTTKLLSRPVELLFTMSIIFSISSMPFVIFRAFFPDLLVAFMSGWWSLLVIPYLVCTSLLGLKVASLFGCGGWARLTAPFHESDD